MNSESIECEYEELYKWVEEHPITRPKRNINRDFSDAMPLVEILKHHFPKLVDMHNYTSKNSYAQKLINWQTLNNRVLKKLKISLSNTRMEQLAKGEVGVIEQLLQNIKKKVETKISGGDNESTLLYLNENSVDCNVKNGKVIKKILPIAEYEKLQADLTEKDEAIKILKSKVEHLENLLAVKDERIKELNKQLQSIVNEDSNLENASASRFFNIF